MKTFHWLTAAGVAAAVGSSIFGLADAPAGGKKKILFYSASFGFRHSCVARPTDGGLSHAEKVLKEFAGKAGYEVHVSQDFNDLNSAGKLKPYAAVIFYTTGNPPLDREALMGYIRGGGAFIGIHPATDTYHQNNGCCPPWPEYIRMIGGAFAGHDQQQEVAIKVEDPGHPSTRHISSDWRILDEIYRFREFSRDNVHVLLSIDTAKISDESLKKLGMKKGGDYPVSWTRTEGKGRVFYTSLAHREDVWTNPVWQQHLLGGLAWATEQAGRN
ncbi:MAG: hypothetical protein AMXMBFR83_24770 [Phycisphaerae bacterium]